jgi:FlaA1/EpsC-like NDP-sugar epimerase
LNLSDIPLDLNGKKVLVAPVSNQSVALVKQLGQSNVGVVGFIDRDPILQSKTIDGLRVMSYQAIANVEADVILLAVHKQHQADILRTLNAEKNTSTQIAVMV